MTTFLLKVWTENSEWRDVDFAVVKVGPEEAERFLRLMDNARAQKEAYPPFYCIQYWDYSLTWHGYDQRLSELLGDATTVTVADDVLGKLSEGERIECVTVVVQECGLHWEGCERYTGIGVNTSGFSRQELEAIVEGRA